MGHFVVRRAEARDSGEVGALAHALWPESSAGEHSRDLGSVIAGKAPGSLPAAIFVAEGADGRIAGFIHAALRSHADGCDPSRPVGFIEGWYVDPEYRRQRAGAQLVAAAEDWARSYGCAEMASDTWVDHLDSQRAHEALGFEVVDRCVNYRKRL